jgi:hypothetical protein
MRFHLYQSLASGLPGIEVVGGADAISAITICLIWPGIFFIKSFLVIHLIVVIVSGLISMVREKKIMLHRLPGCRYC